MRRASDWLVIALGLALLAALIVPQWPRVSRGQNDFVQLYAGGKLAGTPGLYSRAANQDVIQSVLGETLDTVIYTRPPFYAALLKPLAILPYRAAYAAFNALNLACLVVFVVLFAKETPALPAFASFFIPVAAVFLQGQDTPLVLLLAGLAILAIRGKRDFLGGVLLSLCAIKFHLFLPIPVLLLIKQRWRVIAGGAAGTAALTAVGIAVTGFHAIPEFIADLRDPWINFTTSMMPNLHGLASSLGNSARASHLELGLVAAVFAGFVWICRINDNFEFLFALGILAGLLLSFHSGLADQVLLLLAFALLSNACPAKVPRVAMALALTPPAYFYGAGFNIVQPILLLVILALAAFSAVQARQQPALAPA